MKWFGDLSILSKLTILIGFMSLSVIIVGVVSIHSLGKLKDEAEMMKGAADDALDSTNLLQNVQNILYAELEISANANDVGIVHDNIQSIEQQKTAFEATWENLSKDADARQRDYLTKTRASYVKLVQNIEDLRAAGGDPSGMSHAREAIRQSEAIGSEMRNTLDQYSGFTHDEMNRLAQESSDNYEKMAFMLIIQIVLNVIIGQAIGGVVARYGISRPIRSIEHVLKQLAQGDFSQDVPYTQRKDEVGEVARAAMIFKDMGLEKLRLEAQQKEKEKLAIEEKKHFMHNLADSFEKAVGGIMKSVSVAAQQLKVSSQHMTQLSDSAGQQSAIVATASENSSASVTSVASASEELSASIAEIGQQITSTSHKTNIAVTEVAATNQSINELMEAAGRIGQVVDIINNISSQINLLALNATIEAARAGEAGKGFAVVASEVKALAQQTEKATGEIGNLISSMRSMTGQSAERIRTISTTIEAINQAAGVVAAAIEEQNSVTRGIARSINDAANGTTEVTRNIAGISQAVGDTKAAASEVLDSAEALAGQSADLDREVNKFLEHIRKSD